MSIGSDIAKAFVAAAPEAVAMSIYKGLFEQPGGGRLSGDARHMALSMLKGALEEWKTQLAMQSATELQQYKSLYQNTKGELDEVRLKLALYAKEFGPMRIASGG